MMYRRLLAVLCGLLILSGVWAEDGDALQQTVRLPKMKGTVYTLLNKVSEQSGFLFVYDSKLVNNDAVAKIKEGAYSIREAVYKIVGDHTLLLKVIGRHILILHPSIKTEATAARDSSMRPPTFVISGMLKDRDTSEPVANASVFVPGTSIGNITNRDGTFRLSLPDSLRLSLVSFSHVGYNGQSLEAAVLAGHHNVLSMEPKVISLQEVLVRLVDPQKLLKQMMKRRKENYSLSPVYLTSFYREGVELKNKFQSLTEAVFKIYKSPVDDPALSDQIKMLKMNRIDNREKSDSIIAKIKAGIQACLQLDIMKNLPDFLSLDGGDFPYSYSSGDVTYIDNRCVDVVCFKQREDVKGPLHCGELYIDSDNGALLQARIEIQPRYIKEATPIFVAKQSQYAKLTAEKVVYTVSYKPYNGTYYISHVRGDLYFRMKKRHFLASNKPLHTWFEMVTCKVDTTNISRFPRAERLPTRTVFAETDYKYDDSFWGDFNIIPLEEELGRIIERVSLKIEKSDN